MRPPRPCLIRASNFAPFEKRLKNCHGIASFYPVVNPPVKLNGNSTVFGLNPSGRSTLHLQSNYHPINLKQPIYITVEAASCSAGLLSYLLLTVDKSIVLLQLLSFPSSSEFAIHSFIFRKKLFNWGFLANLSTPLYQFILSINYTSGCFTGTCHISTPQRTHQSFPYRTTEEWQKRPRGRVQRRPSQVWVREVETKNFLVRQYMFQVMHRPRSWT